MSYTAWDIEIAVPLRGYNLGDQDVGISCASAVVVGLYDEPLEKVWRSDDGIMGDRMDSLQCMEMVSFLSVMHKRGATLVTFNGLGFDLQVLAREFDRDSLWWLTVADLAYGHIDMYYQFMWERGHRIGLKALAEAVDSSGKTEGMHGGLAPLLWSAGNTGTQEDLDSIAALGLIPGSAEARDFVCEYVLQDSIATGEVYEGILREAGEGIRWTTSAGKLVSEKRAYRPHVKGNGDLFTVHECIKELDEPAQGWMSDPPSLSEPYGWIGYEWDQIRERLQELA